MTEINGSPPKRPMAHHKNLPLLKSDGYLNPVILQLLGVIMLIAFCVYWAFFHTASALLVGASLTLIGLGSAGGALVTVRSEITERGKQHQNDLKEANDGDDNNE